MKLKWLNFLYLINKESHTKTQSIDVQYSSALSCKRKQSLAQLTVLLSKIPEPFTGDLHSYSNHVSVISQHSKKYSSSISLYTIFLLA